MLKELKKNFWLYILLLPSIIFLLIFNFIPLLGNIIAFKNFSLFAGNGILDSILKSEWVGLTNFKSIFSRTDAVQAIANTLIINVVKLIVLSPLPLIVAILLNELRSVKLKKTVQTVIIFPYFLSWVIVSSIFMTVLGGTGILNNILVSLGLDKIYFLVDEGLFRYLLVFSEGWKDVGYGTVVYLAAIVGISPSLYEAAEVDGANRWNKIIHITIPSLLSTFILLTMLKLGYLMSTGFQQVLTMYNPAVYSKGDILGTYIYRTSIGKLDYSLGAAAGLFESLIGFALIIVANQLCRKFSDKSIW